MKNHENKPEVKDKNVSQGKENHQSEFNLLKGKASFTTEPLAYRVFMVVFIALFILALAWILKGKAP